MAEHPVVLLLNDSSEIDLTRPQQQVQGVGEREGSRQGLLLHALHAFTPEGMPLGAVSAQCLNRPQGVSHAPVAQKQRRRKHTPIEHKGSMRWLADLRRAREVAGKLPQVQCVYAAGSEADICESFAEPRGAAGTRGAGRVHWLIRACQDRALQGEQPGPRLRLRDQVLATPVLYRLERRLRARQAKTGAEDRLRRQTRPGRAARVEVRAAPLTLRPPWRADRKLPPVRVNAVLVREPDPPAGQEPVEGVLVTTLPIDRLQQVRRAVEYYCVRWDIEILFRTLKSGCRIERRRFEHVHRVVRRMGLYLIAAWRTLFVCRSGRECPDADCQTIFEPSEWKAVRTAVHRKKPPKERPRLSERVHLIARLGGHVERGNSEPGPQTVWMGLQRMHDLAWAWDTFGPATRIRDA